MARARRTIRWTERGAPDRLAAVPDLNGTSRPTMESPDWKSSFPWMTAIIAGLLFLVAVLALIAYLRTLGAGQEVAEGTGSAIRDAVRELPSIAEKFQEGRITTTFIEGLPDAASTQGNILELAISENQEFFRREDSKLTLWGYLDLGTTVSEVRVPVTFRYHLRLTDPWRLSVRGNVCVVAAPRVRASLPPAIHTDRMEKSTSSGWGRFNKGENLAELERGLTPMLEERASDPRHLRLVREECRKSVAEYVRNWLAREDQWRRDRFTAVVVVFEDELPPGKEAPLDVEFGGRPPTITFEPESGAR